MLSAMPQVMSRRVPYFQLTIPEVVHAIQRREIPQRPDGKDPGSGFIEDGLWKLLENCWNFVPEGRPDCREVLDEFQVLYPQCGPVTGETEEMKISDTVRSKSSVYVDIDQVLYLLREVPLRGSYTK